MDDVAEPHASNTPDVILPAPGPIAPIGMSSDHTAHNQREVTRIFSEHPPREKSTLLRNNRLLNSLSPLRAFGDGRFKLSIADLAHLEDRMLGNGRETQCVPLVKCDINSARVANRPIKG